MCQLLVVFRFARPEESLLGWVVKSIRHVPVCLLLTGGLSATFGQTTYYVANSGSDSNNGRSGDSPFQTVEKVNSLSLQPGDQVLFRRSDTFRGGLKITHSGSSGSPIVIDAYGSGNKPILSGSVPITNWTNAGNNTWEANCPACGSQVTGLYRNQEALSLGRYPNLSDANWGYLTVQSRNGKTQLTSQQSLTTNWTGGEVVVRPTLWILDRAPITNQDGNTLTINNNSSYTLNDGWGFFIQNHPATLDQTGEWYYNPANKTIRLFDNQNDPNGQQVTATVYSEGVNLTNASFVTVRNIQITQTLTAGLSANGGSNLILSGNDITNSGYDGVIIMGSGRDVLVENNRIEDANNDAFFIDSYRDFTFRGNTVRRIGLLPGRGKSGDGGYTALHSLSFSNSLIENNVMETIGFNGISVNSGTTIRTNQIANFCLTKSDGGGIYTWNGNHTNSGGLRILSNIVSNGMGSPEGTPGGVYSGGNGIFLDDCAQNTEILNNTVFGCRSKGYLLRGTKNVTFRGNTSFNNGEEQLRLGFNGVCTFRNNQIQNNVFVSRTPDQGVVAYESDADDLNQYGQFDNNYYARPFEDQFKLWMVHKPGPVLVGKMQTLAEWQAQWGQDRNSFNSPITYKPYVINQTGASLIDAPFSETVGGWNGYSPYGNGRVDWDNSNRLDGGSMRLSFGSASNRGDSYLLAFVTTGPVTKGKNYQLLFDGVASASGKRVQIYPRQLGPNFSDLAARKDYVLGTERQRYESTFTATSDESNAILIIQVEENGQTAWLDNIRLQEVDLTTVNPDEYIKLVYNPTFQDKVETLDGVYRDVKNNVYNRQVTVPAFSSVVLLKEVNQAPTPPPPAPTALRDPENPANAVAGLDYQYYEGNWGTLPDFNSLTPAKTGSTNTPALSVRNRDDNFGVRYTGYVSVPADGVYTFYTRSDDGSKLLIGSTEVVNNDGGHAEQERSGSIGLKAGVHALTVSYFQGSGGSVLVTSFSGPGIDKQPISDAAYRRVSTGSPPTPPPANPAGNGTGLRAEYFNNKKLKDPAVLTRIDRTVDFDWGDDSPAPGTVRDDGFSIRWTGQIEAPATGNYTFTTLADDGVRLWVNGVMLVDDWNDHPPRTNVGPSMELTAGQKYDIRVEYFDNESRALAKLSWSYPGQDQQIVPQSILYPTGGSGRVAAVHAGESDADMTMQVYPIPAREEVWVRYQAEVAGDVTLRLVNSIGVPVSQQIYPVIRGENLIGVPVRDFTRGLYLLTLGQAHQRITKKVLLAE